MQAARRRVALITLVAAAGALVAMPELAAADLLAPDSTASDGAGSARTLYIIMAVLAVLIIVGVLALMGNRPALDAAARHNIWLAYPMNPAPGQYWVLAVWVVLGLVGAFVQLKITGTTKKKT